MGYSKFGKKRRDAIDNYVTRLVQHMVPGDEEKQSELVISSLKKIVHHKFLDTDPKKVRDRVKG